LIIWRDNLATLPIGSQIVYHVLGALFCFVNFVVFFSYVTRYIMEDMVRMNYMPISALFSKLDKKKPVKNTDSISNHDLEAPSTTASVDIPVKDTTKVVKFIIEGQIYDVTSFLNDHPGGREVLIQAGDVSNGDSKGIPDVTNEFKEVGHSKYAHNLLKKYLVSPSDITIESSSHRESAKSFIVDSNENHSSQETEEENVFELPYKIAVEYSTMASNQMFLAVAINILAVYFLCGGFRGSTSSLYSFDQIQQHLSQSLQCAVFPLLIPSLFFIFTPNCKGLLRFENHIAAIFLTISLTLDIALLLCDNQQATGLRLLRISLLLSFTLESMGRRLYVLARPSSLLVGNLNSFAIRNCFYDCAKRVCFSLMDCISMLLIGATALELHSLHVSYKSSTTHNGIAVIAITVTAGVIRIIAIRLLHLSSNQEISDKHPIQITHNALCVVFMSFVFGTVALLCHHFLLTADSIPSNITETLSLLPSLMYSSLLSGKGFTASSLVAYALLTYFYLFLPSFVSWAGAHFVSQVVCLCTLLSLWMMAGSLLHAKWVAFVLMVLALYLISKESSAVLSEPRVKHNKTDIENHSSTISNSSAASLNSNSKSLQHLYAAKQFEEECRSFLAHMMVQWLIRPLLAVANIIAADGLMYYMYPSVLADMGPTCDYGVALQINGSAGGASQRMPSVFQLNVGHLEDDDLLRTTTSTRDMMNEISADPAAGEKGFVSDIVALFPLYGQSGKRGQGVKYTYREINLSAWTSAKAAHEWYRNSPAHKKVVSDYKGRENFNSFSAMFATLAASPQRPLRWEIRCRGCKSMLKTYTNDSPMTCPTCNKTVDPIPFL